MESLSSASRTRLFRNKILPFARIHGIFFSFTRLVTDFRVIGRNLNKVFISMISGNVRSLDSSTATSVLTALVRLLAVGMLVSVFDFIG